MKTRVLMFGWEFPPHNSGGLGVACQGLTRAMAARGIDIIFVMPKKLDVNASWARFVFADTELETRVVNSTLKPYVTGNGYARALHDIGIYGRDLLSEVRRYALLGGQIAKEEQFDVIYAHDWLSFGAGVEAKRVSGKPLIVHVHATEFDRCGGPLGVNKDVYDIEKEGMEAADRVIAVSQYTKDIITRHYGIPDWKIKVIHNGIDEATQPHGAASRLRLSSLKASGYSIVLFLGRITLQKGPDYFLRAAKSVLMRDPKVVFLLSGSGDMERQMMDLAAQLGISDRVLFTGFLSGSDRHEVYAAADLFIMPSVSEPFGITALEAMKTGAPVLVSKQSGVAEAVKHALKVDFWDVDEMTNKILGVVRHKGLRQSLSENGRREVANLTWEDAAGKVENVLQETLLSGVQ
ncbi:MAG TPA: glycosyltransferase family 4 protein [Candidatus Paceibacterota bacterium]|nr:glycosyltransferase family 4 protein [Candidatus Paceibacterota bacterium]